MAVKYTHPRGTLANLTTLASSNGLTVGQLYYVTDQNRIAVATSVSAFQTFSNLSDNTNATNLTSGTLAAGRLPALSGDITSSAGSAATTLATVNSNVGAFGSATQTATFTVNAKGLTTAAGNVTITPAWSSVTSKPTTLSGYSVTAADVLATLLTVDGASSALDADLLDGQQGSFYQSASNLNAGTVPDARISGAYTGISNLSITGALTTSLAGGGSISLNGATANWISYNTNGVGAPAFTTRSNGTKLVIYPSLTGSAADYAVGIDTATLWQSVPTTAQGFKWYGGTTLAATLSGAGSLTLVGDLSAANLAGAGASITALNASNLSTGTVAAARMPAHTGDVTSSAGAVALTLATVNANTGSFGSATATPTFTVNGKGLITAAGSATITPAWSSITSKPTTVSGYGITNAVPHQDGSRTNLNFNTQLTSGFYNTDGSPTNGPSGHAYGQLIVAKGIDTGLQIAGGYNNALYFRGWHSSGTFYGWQKVWTDSNDGAGSGLDADLLNGQAASYYQSASNLNAGTVAAARMPALTGDITTSAGAVVTTLATVNSNVGSFGSATAAATFTVNGKGLVTAAGSTTITPAWSSITSKPTTLSGYGITDAVAASAFTFANLSNKPTTLSGYAITDGLGSTVGTWINSSEGQNRFNFASSSHTFYKTGAAHIFYNSADASRMTLDASGNLTCAGDITAYSSDARLKHNVVPITDPLTKIAAISGYTFDWNRELVDALGFTPYQYEDEHGFLAQEIAQVVPDAVRPAHFHADYLTVKYERVIPLAVEAIKALKAENDDLRMTLTMVIARLQALEAKAA